MHTPRPTPPDLRRRGGASRPLAAGGQRLLRFLKPTQAQTAAATQSAAMMVSMMLPPSAGALTQSERSALYGLSGLYGTLDTQPLARMTASTPQGASHTHSAVTAQAADARNQRETGRYRRHSSNSQGRSIPMKVSGYASDQR